MNLFLTDLVAKYFSRENNNTMIESPNDKKGFGKGRGSAFRRHDLRQDLGFAGVAFAMK
jgi:hypothetical protein